MTRRGKPRWPRRRLGSASHRIPPTQPRPPEAEGDGFPAATSSFLGAGPSECPVKITCKKATPNIHIDMLGNAAAEHRGTMRNCKVRAPPILRHLRDIPWLRLRVEPPAPEWLIHAEMGRRSTKTGHGTFLMGKLLPNNFYPDPRPRQDVKLTTPANCN